MFSKAYSTFPAKAYYMVPHPSADTDNRFFIVDYRSRSSVRFPRFSRRRLAPGDDYARWNSKDTAV